MPSSSHHRRAHLVASPVIIACVGVALTGCMRTKVSLERHPPTIEARSPHTVAELSACMSDNLTRYSESNVSFVPRPDGATLTYNFVDTPFLTVTMVDHGEYRQVTVFGPYGLHTKVTRYRLDAVRKCL